MNTTAPTTWLENMNMISDLLLKYMYNLNRTLNQRHMVAVIHSDTHHL